jgi:hypothetical protein
VQGGAMFTLAESLTNAKDIRFMAGVFISGA